MALCRDERRAMGPRVRHPPSGAPDEGDQDHGDDEGSDEHDGPRFAAAVEAVAAGSTIMRCKLAAQPHAAVDDGYPRPSE
jgi:hypothetical protein